MVTLLFCFCFQKAKRTNQRAIFDSKAKQVASRSAFHEVPREVLSSALLCNFEVYYPLPSGKSYRFVRFVSVFLPAPIALFLPHTLTAAARLGSRMGAALNSGAATSQPCPPLRLFFLFFSLPSSFGCSPAELMLPCSTSVAAGAARWAHGGGGPTGSMEGTRARPHSKSTQRQSRNPARRRTETTSGRRLREPRLGDAVGARRGGKAISHGGGAAGSRGGRRNPVKGRGRDPMDTTTAGSDGGSGIR